jgi:hypothetical protein
MEIRKELGYYQCGNKIFRSKIQACLYSSETDQEIKWFFNNETFDKVDWTEEPTNSLDFYYDQRAKEIREKYDYVILSYSGGSDSHNILKAFQRQKLILDEVLVNVYEKMNKTIDNNIENKDSSNYGAEYKLQIYPRLQEIKNEMPQTKVTVCDLSDKSMEMLGDEEWFLKKQEALNLSGSSRYDYWSFYDMKKTSDHGKKIAIIVGTEKPFLFVLNNMLHFGFVDKLTNLSSVEPHRKEYENVFVEYFYWHPSCVDMIRKQIHIVKKWMESNPQYIKLWSMQNRSEYQKNIPTIHKILRNLIYTTWQENWYQTDKNVLEWNCEIDDWFHKLYSNTKEYSIWKSGINYVVKNAQKYIEWKNGVPDGLKSFHQIYQVGYLKL